MRILFVHAGGSKTGTTSLQNFLDLETEALSRAGLTYGHRVGVTSPYSPTSGNGWPLLHLLNTTDPGDYEVDALLESYLEDRPAGIVSTERFELVPFAGWQKLVASARRREVKVHIIFSVRDPVAYFVSRYDQAIKRHGEFRAPLVWLRDEPWRHLDFLLCLDQMRDSVDFDILHYGADPGNVVARIGEILSPELAVVAGNRAYLANRSLTNRERQTLLYINEHYDRQVAINLSTFLLQNYPNLPPEKLCDHAFHAAIEERWTAGCAWINERFFKCCPVITAHQPRPMCEPPPATDVDFGKILIDWSLSRDRAALR